MSLRLSLAWQMQWWATQGVVHRGVLQIRPAYLAHRHADCLVKGVNLEQATALTRGDWLPDAAGRAGKLLAALAIGIRPPDLAPALLD
jgi:hypothetical protein